MNIIIKEMTELDFDELEAECLLGQLFELGPLPISKIKELHGERTYRLLEKLQCQGFGGYIERDEWDPGLDNSDSCVVFITVEGFGHLQQLASRYELNSIDYQIGRTLARLDLPISALLSAAYDKADHINRALIGGCWKQIVNMNKERYRTPAGVLKGETVAGIEDPDEARGQYIQRTFEIAESYFRPLLKILKQSEEQNGI